MQVDGHGPGPGPGPGPGRTEALTHGSLMARTSISWNYDRPGAAFMVAGVAWALVPATGSVGWTS